MRLRDRFRRTVQESSKQCDDGATGHTHAEASMFEDPRNVVISACVDVFGSYVPVRTVSSLHANSAELMPLLRSQGYSRVNHGRTACRQIKSHT